MHMNVYKCNNSRKLDEQKRRSFAYVLPEYAAYFATS